jgi:hypothetical protein
MAEKPHSLLDLVDDPIPRDKNGKVTYSGRLSKPLRITKIDELPSNDERLEYLFDLMRELFDFYQIDRSSPHSGDRLAFSLALEHVPGFQIKHKNKGGRPKKWTDNKKRELVIAVETILKMSPELDKQQACELAVKLGWFPPFRLYQTYMEAKRVTKT